MEAEPFDPRDSHHFRSQPRVVPLAGLQRQAAGDTEASETRQEMHQERVANLLNVPLSIGKSP